MNSVAGIPARLGRAPSTIGREVAHQGAVVKVHFCAPSLDLDARQ